MKGIYRFKEDCGRMGGLEGIFVADSDEVANLQGETICFGEVLGKHSEIEADISEENLTLISDDPAAVEMFEKLELQCGHNPFDHYEGFDHGDHPDRPD